MEKATDLNQWLLKWWAHQDLNLGPKDYAYYYSFRCLFPVCSLDCLLSLRPTRTVSTPSKHYCLAWLFALKNRASFFKMS